MVGLGSSGNRGDAVREWKVKPNPFEAAWELITPDGDVFNLETGGSAVQLGLKLAKENHGLLLVYGLDGGVEFVGGLSPQLKAQ